jgi:hypothetical protein
LGYYNADFVVFHCFLKSAYPVSGVAAVAGVVAGVVAGGARPSKSVILPLYEYRLAFSRNILFPGVAEAGVEAVAAVAGVEVVAVANLCDLSFVVVCKFRLDTVLYDFSFTKTSGVSSAAAGAAAGVASVAAVGVAAAAVFRSLALLYSSLISTWISLGAFVSIIYFLEIVSKYL